MKPLSDKEHYIDSFDETEPHYYHKDIADAVKRLKDFVEEKGVADISPYNVINAIDDIFGEFK